MKNITIILISIFLSSCTFSQKAKEDNSDFSYLKERLLKRENYIIPDSLFSFFPNKSDKYKDLEIGIIHENSEKVETPFKAEKFDGYKIIEGYQCKNTESLELLVEEYTSQSTSTIKSESTSYFVIDSERELYKEYDTTQLKNRYLLAEDNVILSFKKSLNEIPYLYDSTTICGLPTGYEILVLKSGSDFVLPKDYLYEWSVFPEKLKHGYRSGVAFKKGEPYIIYWTVAW